jgi:hypothetical protein
MRPLANWLVIGALALVGLFAARDAMRGGDGPPSGQPTTPPEKQTTSPPRLLRPPGIARRARLAARLKALGAKGVLRLTDGNSVHYLLQIPSLRWTTSEGVLGHDCVSGTIRVVHERSGIAAQQVNAETIEVSSEVWSVRFQGVSPSFKPGGTLTFVRGGRLYEWTVRCGSRAATVTFQGRREIDRCVEVVRGAPHRLLEVAWVGTSDYAAIAGSQTAAGLVVVRDGRARSLFRSVGATVSGLQASSQGRYFAARVGGSIFVFDSRRPGNLALPPGAERPRAVAWSDDEQFTALASEDLVYVYRPEVRKEAVALPLAAIALDWR